MALSRCCKAVARCTEYRLCSGVLSLKARQCASLLTLGAAARQCASLLTLGAAACSGVGVPRPGPLAPASARPPASFVASTSDAKTTRVIPVRDGLTKPTLFRAATDALAQKYVVDVSDARAGFLMTSWQASAVRDGVPDLRYRTRIILRFLGDDWKQAQVKVEANWQHGDEWNVGYDAPLLDQVTDEVRAKIGRR